MRPPRDRQLGAAITQVLSLGNDAGVESGHRIFLPLPIRRREAPFRFARGKFDAQRWLAILLSSRKSRPLRNSPLKRLAEHQPSAREGT
jgi:hypothetical protein